MPPAGEGKERQGLSRASEQSEGNLKPLVTVITPCLNSIDTIAENLLSVQSAREVLIRAGWELEHLVVEGGSVDGTVELIANHAAQHSYCQMVSNVKGGPYAAMNAGLLQAKGLYTHVLNSDDLLLDSDAYANFVLEGYDKGATVLIASIGYFRRPGRQLKSLWKIESIPVSETEWRKQLMQGLHYPHPGFIACTTTYRVEGFDESYSLSADYKLMQNILLAIARPVTTLICQQPLIAMAEGGATGNWRAILKGRKQLAAINQELGIKTSSLMRYWGKVKQRLQPMSRPIAIISMEAHEQ